MLRSLLALALLSAPALAAAPAPVLTYDQGFATPESVLYDAASDTYLVSNIDGSPLGKDNNGFISELSPDGKVIAARLIAGGKDGVTLNAPKGMAIAGGKLYVADIDVVRVFDRKTGKPVGEIGIDGVNFLNDVAVGADGLVYISDTAVDASFATTGKDAIYKVKNPTAQSMTAAMGTFLRTTDLHGPNGLLVTGESVTVVSFATNELRVYGLDGKPKGGPTALPNGGLDGIVAAGEDLLVSSWGGQAIYRGRPGGSWTAVVTGLEAPADIGYDTKRKRLLVPRFQANSVEVWELN